jgi:23S rRNA (pseudouridine1915-N3)-methyltransferase
VRIALVKRGRVAYPEIRALVAMYEERLRPFARVELSELKDPEARAGAVKPAAGHRLVALDERGQQWTSPELAAQLQRWQDDPGTKSVTFLVGGPMGLDDETRRAADVRWSLSKATLTSDMAWLLLVEQIYRAFNILKGTGYHHD